MGHKHILAALAWIALFGLGDLPEGFTRILDGRTTSGWHFSGTVHHGTTGVAAVTRDGVLQLTQKPFGQGGLFLTDKTYTNFELYLEVKVPFATNSGIFLRSTEGGSAYQIELVQGGGTGALFGELLRISQAIPAPDLTGIWKIDEFNAIRVRMEGEAPHITIWINGVKTGEVQEPRNDQIGGAVGGHIGLQLHWQDTYEPRRISGGGMSNAMKPGHPLEFRNIGIKELPAPSNGVDMTFIRIEPGKMQVGVFHPDCDNGGGGRGGAPRDPRMVWDEADRAACEAQTRADRSDGFPVTIAKPYLIAKTEVTQGQWRAVMGSNPSLFQGDRVTNPDNHPVDSVSWEDTQAFVKALNAREKTTAYRLPTEFEWEYACRAGGPGQQTWTDIRAQAVLGLGLAGRGGGDLLPSETPAQYTARTGMTNEVGLKAPNAWGVHDMLGNVWEWVADPYNGRIFPDATPPKSGSPRRGSGQAIHVLKGGGFASDVKNAICATHGFGPGDRFAVGFRVVKDVQ